MMSDGTTATASGMDTHKRWFLLDYEPTSVRVCVCVRERERSEGELGERERCLGGSKARSTEE